MASWARIRGVAPPWEMVVFSSATLEAFSAWERRVDWYSSRNTLMEGRNSPSWLGSFWVGRRRTKPFSNSSRPKHLT